MKKLLFTFLGFLNFIFVANAFSQVLDANITKTHWAMSGGLDYSTFSQSSGSYNTFDFNINPEYFIKDHISLGVAMDLQSGTSSSTYLTMGPSATMHFWKQEKLTLSGNGAFLFGITPASPNLIIRAKLGLNYFIYPSISFGPSFVFRYYDRDRMDLTRLSFAVGFSIYL